MTTLLFLFSVPAAQAQEEGDTWKYNVIAYGWLAGFEGKVAAPGGGALPVEVEFTDLTDNLDFGGSIRFEAWRSRFSLFGDVFYANLGADAQVGEPPTTVTLDSKEWVLEAGGGYRLGSGFEALLLGRLYSLITGLQIDGSDAVEVSHTWIDAYAGARWNWVFGERWPVGLRADLGFGGSDFAWFASAYAGYRLNDRTSLVVGYRALYTDYETGAGTEDFFKWDVTLHGLALGVWFTF
jgi:hypothetical protein